MEIKLTNVSFTYYHTLLLKNINIIGKEGEITTLLGSSDTHKSEVLALISGLYKIDQGSILLGNIDITKLSLSKKMYYRKKIGYLPRHCEKNLYCKDVLHEFESILKMMKIKDSYHRKKKEVLESVGLDTSYLKRKITTLTKSEKVKVSFASLLLKNPEVLLLDEPFLSLNTEDKNTFFLLLKKLKRKGVTILLATKDTVLAQKVSDFIYLFSSEQIIYEGESYTVLSDEKRMKKCNLMVPPLLKFVDTVRNRKNVKLMYRDDVNDLIKDVYRYVR